jgi:hypothetical protein
VVTGWGCNAVIALTVCRPRQDANGRTKKEILRLLKRAIAREVFRLLTRPTPIDDYSDLRPARQAKNITLATVAGQGPFRRVDHVVQVGGLDAENSRLNGSAELPVWSLKILQKPDISCPRCSMTAGSSAVRAMSNPPAVLGNW